ncbi:MAG: orotidine-5'-phosphate decarboxylase, partial [Bacteroidetes bacterium]|nr:orotidine-5'-phosphate decarboxylase [Candidatus Cryptobacteroides intestinigallinarum]
MDREALYRQIQAKRTMLCVGLDVDFAKMPECIKVLAENGELIFDGESFKGTARSIVEFNKAIIDATAAHCVAYKPNLAFYECYGIDGMRALDATVDYIRSHYPEIFLIADAKRGDIGNTAKMYAKAFFETMDFDAVTVAPYMG